MPARSVRTIVVTGFEPFGGHRINPSAEIARALDGATVAGARIVGRVLPVDFGRLDRSLDRALKGLRPAAVIALGLAAGEPVIRLERIAVNLADFPIPDNAGRSLRAEPLSRTGPTARPSRLPLAAIEHALLERGIPARQSNSAGTYLCNAAMYRLLERLPSRIPCGFIHLPALPQEVAGRLLRGEATGSETGIAALATMALETMRRGIEIAVGEVARTGARRGRRRAAARA